MSHSNRGPDRRLGSDAPETLSGPPASERRGDAVRRRHGYISELDLCRGLDYAKVEHILERCPRRDLALGEALLEPGQANHHLYFLLEGRLDVRLQSVDSPPVDSIAVGECIGEMSIIDGLPTSAFVIATEPSSVIAVHGSIFWSKIATNPTVVRNLTRVLAERMRKRNDATLRAVEKEFRLEQLQKDLLAAYETQTGILPLGPVLLEEIQNLDIYARMDVVKSVGGDFYDAFRLDDRRICVAVGDVSGKGMPAALFMVRTMTLLRAEIAKKDPLAKCIEKFNRALCDSNISHMFVSLIVLRIDLNDGTVEYVNAGHPPMLISRSTEPFVAVDASQGLISGVLADNEYTAAYATLERGDRLVLYTDGITEARDTGRNFYGEQRLTNFLSNGNSVSSAEIVNELFNDVEVFSKDAEQSDDITVLAIAYDNT